MPAVKRSYSDPAFGSKKVIRFTATGSLAGTAAIALKDSHRFMQPAVVTDVEVFYVAGGTSADATQVFNVGKSLAGTGAFSSIGSISIGTQATGTTKDGSVTETEFAAGDEIQLYAGGTGAIVANGIVQVQYRESFVVGNE